MTPCCAGDDDGYFHIMKNLKMAGCATDKQCTENYITPLSMVSGGN